jgi:chromosome segregation ATPase
MGNPFTTVLKEITKMIALIDKEEKADDDQLSWCNSERETNDEAHGEKVQQISDLKSAIDELTTLIEDPETGLKVQITATEDDLTTNHANQKDETTSRTEQNLAYQKDIANIVEAEKILQKAIVVLKDYYAKIAKEEGGLLQKGRRREDPSPPETWENGKYKGQSEKGTGAIGMLEYILENTKKEEKEAHDDESNAQQAFEDSMADLKEEEANLEKSLADLRSELAVKEKELLDKQQDLKTTKAEKAAIEAYLAKIKPGCDFITSNIDKRKENRASEKAALEKATTLLKETPAYKAAVAEAHDESLGKCLDTCKGQEGHAECKACLAGVTVPGYCAGHPDTEGC